MPSNRRRQMSPRRGGGQSGFDSARVRFRLYWGGHDFDFFDDAPALTDEELRQAWQELGAELLRCWSAGHDDVLAREGINLAEQQRIDGPERHLWALEQFGE